VAGYDFSTRYIFNIGLFTSRVPYAMVQLGMLGYFRVVATSIIWTLDINSAYKVTPKGRQYYKVLGSFYNFFFNIYTKSMLYFKQARDIIFKTSQTTKC
jgi:hypothetical protein